MKGLRTVKKVATPKLTRKALESLLRTEFPEMFNAESGYALEDPAPTLSHPVVALWGGSDGARGRS